MPIDFDKNFYLGICDYEIEMEPMDYTVASGNKLGLIIYSTDPQFTVIPFSNTKFGINRNSIDLSIPY